MDNDILKKSKQPFGFFFEERTNAFTKHSFWLALTLTLLKYFWPLVFALLFSVFAPEKYQVSESIIVGVLTGLFIINIGISTSRTEKRRKKGLHENGFAPAGEGDVGAKQALEAFSLLQAGARLQKSNHYHHSGKEVGIFTFHQKVGTGKGSRRTYSAAYVRLNEHVPHIVFDDKTLGDGSDIILRNVSNYDKVDGLTVYDVQQYGDAFKDYRVLHDPAQAREVAAIVSKLASRWPDLAGYEYELNGDYAYVIGWGVSAPQHLLSALEDFTQILGA